MFHIAIYNDRRCSLVYSSLETLKKNHEHINAHIYLICSAETKEDLDYAVKDTLRIMPKIAVQYNAIELPASTLNASLLDRPFRDKTLVSIKLEVYAPPSRCTFTSTARVYFMPGWALTKTDPKLHHASTTWHEFKDSAREVPNHMTQAQVEERLQHMVNLLSWRGSFT